MCGSNSGIALLFHQLIGQAEILLHFFFFVKIVLAILGPWHFHVNLKLSFKFLPKGQKASARILIVIPLTLQMN